MRQFDVYKNPIAGMRSERPFVVVLQHDRVLWAQRVIVAPLGLSHIELHLRIMPRLDVAGRTLTLLTLDLSSLDRERIRGIPIDNLDGQRLTILNALDAVFSAAG